MGISGPYFLLLYAGLLIVAWIVVLAARWWRIAARPGAPAVPDQPELGLYEAAMLNGGGRAGPSGSRLPT